MLSCFSCDIFLYSGKPLWLPVLWFWCSNTRAKSAPLLKNMICLKKRVTPFLWHTASSLGKLLGHEYKPLFTGTRSSMRIVTSSKVPTCSSKLASCHHLLEFLTTDLVGIRNNFSFSLKEFLKMHKQKVATILSFLFPFGETLFSSMYYIPNLENK